jgi:hypothetical protein
MEKILILMSALVLATGCGEKTEAPKNDAKPKAGGSNSNSEESAAKTITLECGKENHGVFAYSFEKEMNVNGRKETDLVLYFDGDDCAQGAIFGNDDEAGYLFPVGEKAWSELSLDKIPLSDSKTEGAIMPITKDKEGLAFWVKTTSGRFAMVRIKSVQPANHAAFASGTKAKVELEWAWQSSN